MALLSQEAVLLMSFIAFAGAAVWLRLIRMRSEDRPEELPFFIPRSLEKKLRSLKK